MALESRIIPIVGPSIRWTTFLKDTQNIFGYSLTQSLDASGLKLTDYKKFLVALGGFQDNKVNPLSILKNNETILQHLHFSFLIVGSTELILRINESTRLDTISTKIEDGYVAFVSGSLANWRCLTEELCMNSEDCKIGKDLLDSFFQLGLGSVV